MGDVQFYNGSVLFADGAVAMDPNCCCGQEFECPVCPVESTLPAGYTELSTRTNFSMGTYTATGYECDNPTNYGEVTFETPCNGYYVQAVWDASGCQPDGEIVIFYVDCSGSCLNASPFSGKAGFSPTNFTLTKDASTYCL